MWPNIWSFPASSGLLLATLFSTDLIGSEALTRVIDTDKIYFPPQSTFKDYEGEADTQSSAFLATVTSTQVTPSVNASASRNVIRQYNVETIKEFNKNLSQAFTRFGVHLLRVIRSSDNVVFSPFSIAMGLAVIQQGTEGATKMQISKALGMYAKASAKASQKLLSKLKQRNSTNILNIASAIFAHNSPTDHFNVKPGFRRKAFYNFNTPVIYDANFDDVYEATDIVNNWVARRTNGFIQKLLPAEAISENTRLVLANAILFKGRWKIPFDPSQSEEMNFNLANGQVKRTQFMHGVGKYRAGNFDGATFVVLPYEGEQYAFMGILPQRKKSMEALINNLNYTTLLNKLTRSTVKDVKLSMPKFAIQKQLNLQGVLSRLRVTKIFSEPLSKIGDFKGIPPVISSAVHSAALIVDEKGITAAAATAYGATALSGDDKTVYFWADRPFLGILWDVENLVPLFMTRLEDPTIF